MTYLTIFGHDYEGDDADTILLHADSADAHARGMEWLEEDQHSYDYMKIMLVGGAGASEVTRLEWV